MNSFYGLNNLFELYLQKNHLTEIYQDNFNNLPELTFLNLMNSNPNVIIPNSVRERLDDEGNGYYYLN